MAAPIQPIQIGRYVLHDEIASGGMAAVHFGRLVGTAGFSKTVAIKRLHRRFAGEPSFRKMILEEGRLAARIRHPNVVPPLDVLAEGGELLLVMEYVHGESLSKLLRVAWSKGERVPLAVAATIFAQVLHGLHAAHEAKDEAGVPLGIVHRDVSPQNILVGADGVARVIDFGIAKAVTSGESTTTGTIKGKVPYLAPEQLEGEPATRRTDLWSAAVCFWEVLAGRRLFDGGVDPEILRQILEMPVPRPSAENDGVPPAIDALVLRALAREPAKRFETAREMAVAIESTVHLATATVVGAWAERLAATKLSERAAKLARVEQTPVEASKPPPPPPPPPPESLTLASPVRALSSFEQEETLTLASPVSVAQAGLPETTMVSQSGGPAPRASQAPQVEIVVIPPPAQVGAPPPVVAPEVRIVERAPETLAARTPRLLAELPRHGASAVQAPTAAPIPVAVQKPKEGSGGRRVASWLIALVLLSLVALWLVAPFLVRRAVVAAAARQGVTLTIDRVEVSRRAIRLVDVRAESGELAGIVAHAASATIGLRRYAPERVTIDDLVLDVGGAAPEVASRVDAWRTAHGASLRDMFASCTQFNVSSGRVEWKEIAGAGSALSLENGTLEVTKSGARLLGDDWRFSAPLVKARAGITTAGAWHIDADRSGSSTRLVVHFDPSGTYPATVTWTLSDDGSVTLSLAVPPTPLAELHIPPALLGTLATDRSRLEARGEVAVVIAQLPGGKVGRQASGRIVLAGASLAAFPGGPPVDVALELPIAGDPSQPIVVTNATLTVAQSEPNGIAGPPAATAPVVGKVEISPVTRVELAGMTTPLPCAKALGQTTLVVQLALAFDNLAASRLGLTPSAACLPRLSPHG